MQIIMQNKVKTELPCAGAGGVVLPLPAPTPSTRPGSCNIASRCQRRDAGRRRRLTPRPGRRAKSRVQLHPSLWWCGETPLGGCVTRLGSRPPPAADARASVAYDEHAHPAPAARQPGRAAADPARLHPPAQGLGRGAQNVRQTLQPKQRTAANPLPQPSSATLLPG